MTWFIEREDGQLISGPYETKGDAFTARSQLAEKLMSPETFWIRSDEESRANRDRHVEMGVKR